MCIRDSPQAERVEHLVEDDGGQQPRLVLDPQQVLAAEIDLSLIHISEPTRPY